MGILNKAQVEELFRREAVMLGSEDRVPEYRVTALFGKYAVKHAKTLKLWNSYGTGDFSLGYLTYKGFQAAASFYNVQQLRKEAEDYEKEVTA